MRRLAARPAVFVFSTLLTLCALRGDEGARWSLPPVGATVGDPVELTLEVEAPDGERPDPASFSSELGPFSILEQRWERGEGRVWTWHGRVAAYEPGALEVPARTITTVEGSEIAVPGLSVSIESVLGTDPGGASEIADLKDPAALAADYRALRLGAAVLVGFLALAGLLWWLHRRYATRITGVATRTDVFERVPPHEWVYEALQALLAKRLAEAGEGARFHEELSAIVKRYLGGRFRVELMERTTGEVPSALRHAGVDPGVAARVRALLEACDAVKFAGAPAGATECRAVTEAAYGVVDDTKPQPETGGDERGAA